MAFPDALRDGFVVADRRWPWGTTFEAVLAEHPGSVGPDPRWLEVPSTRLGPLTTVTSAANAYHPARPIVTVSYGLPVDVGDEAGMAALHAQLDALLGEGRHERVTDAPGGVRVSSRWALSTTVAVSTWVGPRDERLGRTGGRLWVYGDQTALAAPYLAYVRGKGAAWATTAGEVEAFETGGDPVEPLDALGEARLAVRDPLRRRTPDWIAGALAPTERALFTHPSGVWGVADRAACAVWRHAEPVTLVHTRLRPMRGPGAASLHHADGARLFALYREDSLDRLVAAIVERGLATVEVKAGVHH